jgi:FMN phosphatase YigB (HAD superfamily)
MIRALLLDLDDTLLGNNTRTFMDHYFALLSEYAGSILDKSTFLPSLIQSTQATIKNTDPALTNAAVFWANFEALTGGRRDELEPFFRRFYETEFPRLRATTTYRPAAAELVRSAFDHGLMVVIATNPLFPQTAIEQRLDWAGVPVNEFPYALVTSYEIMHATKPQLAYYHEILAAVNCSPEEAVMAGDDWKNDIAPAAAVGIMTYWVTNGGSEPPEPAMTCGIGPLEDLMHLVAAGEIDRLAHPSSRQ